MKKAASNLLLEMFAGVIGVQNTTVAFSKLGWTSEHAVRLQD